MFEIVLDSGESLWVSDASVEAVESMGSNRCKVNILTNSLGPVFVSEDVDAFMSRLDPSAFVDVGGVMVRPDSVQALRFEEPTMVVLGSGCFCTDLSPAEVVAILEEV